MGPRVVGGGYVAAGSTPRGDTPAAGDGAAAAAGGGGAGGLPSGQLVRLRVALDQLCGLVSSSKKELELLQEDVEGYKQEHGIETEEC